MPHDDLCVTRVPIFRGLGSAEQEAVAALARPLRLARGEHAYVAGAAVGRLLVVHHGRLTLVHRSADGREQVVRVLQEGDFVGEEAFLTGARPDHDAVAAGEVQLCTFAHADLTGLVTRYPGSRSACPQRQRHWPGRTDFAAVAAHVGARVATYLLDQPVGRDAAGRPVVRLDMAKKHIASYLGTTPESFSRALAALTRAGAIRTAGRRDVVLTDVPALEARARQ
jgi:CRP/FNR family transcriptional regulator